MKKALLLLLLIVSVSCTDDDSSQENSNVFNGDVNLATQAELETFGLNNYTEIIGNLIIGDPNFITDINDLQYLSSLEKVGSLSISVDDLTSFNGLNNLTEVNGDFYVRSVNDNMLNFNGLNNLSTVNGNIIITRSYFTDLTGLNNLDTISGDLEISSCYTLSSFLGFQAAIIGGDFRVINCNFILDLSGVESLTTINGDLIIQGNDDLTTLNGLQNLSTVGSITIGDVSQFGWNAPNQSLSDLCAIRDLVVNGSFTQFSASNNLYNPSVNDMLINNCRL
ncbi:hypothetical protein JCM19296_360 [Nonlabens ulvanivorans]|uniref:Uncharacterized protein n=1 Tax=Nonlabens ulvanivorans TaxID=906888 RepID=A0A081D786_NONUL|nr:hypothetical protein [Nonlabens ulvanivorans]GAK74782.1 hypothetical protein JCM19296_360 [Nonlabens ulvanivorans]